MHRMDAEDQLVALRASNETVRLLNALIVHDTGLEVCVRSGQDVFHH